MQCSCARRCKLGDRCENCNEFCVRTSEEIWAFKYITKTGFCDLNERFGDLRHQIWERFSEGVLKQVGTIVLENYGRFLVRVHFFHSSHFIHCQFPSWSKCSLVSGILSMGPIHQQHSQPQHTYMKQFTTMLPTISSTFFQNLLMA